MLSLFLALLLLVQAIGTFGDGQPPKQPPAVLLKEYTMNDSVPLEQFYVDDSNKGQRTHYSFSEESVAAYLQSAHQQLDFLRQYDSQDVEGEGDVNANAVFDVLHKKYWPMYAMSQYKDRFQGAHVAVFGSMDPYVETIALALGASTTTTFEFNDLTFRHEQMHVVCGDAYLQVLEEHQKCTSSAATVDSLPLPAERHDHPYSQKFDIVLSISSFDHSGLGRYGDALDPLGDVNAMKFVKTVMKASNSNSNSNSNSASASARAGNGDSLLFLTVPVGPDVVVWNLHRRYGRARLPLLLAGFSTVRAFGYKQQLLARPASWRQTYEPVFVLRATREDQGKDQVQAEAETGAD